MGWKCRLVLRASYTPRQFFVTGDPCSSEAPDVEEVECEEKDDKIIVTVFLPIARYECVKW